MRPSPEVVDLTLGVLGRAQARTAMTIHAFVFMSNHYHLLLSPRDPKHLADFMCFTNSNIAREIGRVTGFRQRFFGRRYQSIEVSDEEAAQVERLEYLLSHGVKENLVASPADWPGAHSVHALLHGEALQGTWFSRTREFEARRKGQEFGMHEFATTYAIRLSPLPCWEHLSVEAHRVRVAERVEEIERQGRLSGREPLGVARILRQNPLDCPEKSKRSPAPSFHAATKAARLALGERLSRLPRRLPLGGRAPSQRRSAGLLSRRELSAAAAVRSGTCSRAVARALTGVAPGVQSRSPEEGQLTSP